MAAKKGKALMKTDDKTLAKMAEQEYENEKGGGGGQVISIRNDEFTLNGEALGDVIDVVIVDNRYEHAYYDSPYDADDPKPPACFAIGENEEELEPHEDSPVPQSETCEDCWANEWGSSPTGKGKLCKNSRRLALLAMGEDGVSLEEMPILKVPPKSLKNFSGYAKRTAKITKRPLCTNVSQISFDDTADYEVLKFSFVSTVDDHEEIEAIVEKREEAVELLETPFDTSNYTPPKQNKPKRSKKKVPVRKKVAKKKLARSKMS